MNYQPKIVFPLWETHSESLGLTTYMLDLVILIASIPLKIMKRGMLTGKGKNNKGRIASTYKLLGRLKDKSSKIICIHNQSGDTQKN